MAGSGVATLGAIGRGEEATAADVEVTRRVFAALAKGDSAPAVESLGADVRWNAVASRESSRVEPSRDARSPRR